MLSRARTAAGAGERPAVAELVSEQLRPAVLDHPRRHLTSQILSRQLERWEPRLRLNVPSPWMTRQAQRLRNTENFRDGRWAGG